MKTIIITLGLMLAISLTAQTKYYSNTKTFYESGYTYQCDVRGSGIATLYNKNNQWTYTAQIYAATGENFAPTSDKWVPLTERKTGTSLKRESIVKNRLSESEKQRAKGDVFSINMYINPQTGKIVEVSFEFHKTSPFATIPVSVYRNIETDLKSQLSFTPTDEGKKLNFICHSWICEF